MAAVNVVPAVIVLGALLLPCAAEAAPASFAPREALRGAGKSFLDYASVTHAEEPSYSVPANFPGPLAAQPRRKPEPGAMALACLGLILYLGHRRHKALAAAAP